jgi:hypothetical protein
VQPSIASLDSPFTTTDLLAPRARVLAPALDALTGLAELGGPRGSGRMLTLWEVAAELSRRLTSIFLVRSGGTCPVLGATRLFQHDPMWRDLVPFHEYFHGDTGAGLGPSHQTGWTALVAKLLQQHADGAPDTHVIHSRRREVLA